MIDASTELDFASCIDAVQVNRSELVPFVEAASACRKLRRAQSPTVAVSLIHSRGSLVMHFVHTQSDLSTNPSAPSLAAYTRAIAPLAFASLLGGCGQNNANAQSPPVGSEPTTTTFMAQPSLTITDDVVSGDDEQRRGYGAVDMRFNACVARENDHVLKGVACPPGILIYGPYVPVPSNSQVEISFEVQSGSALELYADLVSQMGKQVIAGLNPQTIPAGQNQRVGYFVNLAEADTNVESRIGFRAQQPVEFAISNLTMTVH